MRNFIFIRTTTESAVFSVDSLERIEYTSNTSITLTFTTDKLKGVIVLQVDADRAQDAIVSLSELLSKGTENLIYTDVQLRGEKRNGVYDKEPKRFASRYVTSIVSISVTETLIAQGPTGATGPAGATGATGATGPAGPTYGSITCGFFDDIGTSTHYLPLNGPPTEQASDNNSYVDWLCPCNIVVKSVQLRFSNLSGAGNLTMTVEKDAIGSAVDTDVESETVAVTGTDDQNVVHFLFDNAAVSKGEKLKIKIIADADVTGSSNNFAVVVYEADWDNRYTQASGVISS